MEPRLGTDLVRFFWTNQEPAAEYRSLGEFSDEYVADYPNPTRILQAARKLCDNGVLIEVSAGQVLPVRNSEFVCISDASLVNECLRYGTYDFLVGGFAAIRERLGPGVIQLEVKQGGDTRPGSSYVVATNALVTARHCVEEADSVHAVVAEERIEPVDWLFPEDGRDMAILRFDRSSFKTVLIAAPPVPLEPVMTMGYPKLPGLRPALLSSVGEIAGTAKAFLDSDSSDFVITTCSMTGGSSGGPVVDSGGRVVGVVSALPGNEKQVDPGRFGMVVPVNDLLLEHWAELRQWCAGGEKPAGFTKRGEAASGR